MREIVTLQIGGCGNAVAEAFWNVISSEHGIEPNCRFSGDNLLQLERINVFFNEINKSYYARAVSADTDRSNLDKLKNSRMGLLFPPSNLFSGSETGTGNNFAKGYYTKGRENLDDIVDCIRREAESSDSLQGFQVIHSLGGGTGSGLGSLLLEKLCDHYPNNIIQTFSIVPSPRFSDVVVEPYNTILSLQHLINNSHLTFAMDNEAISDICIRNLGLASPYLKDMNHIIAHTMSGITTCLRFPGQLNSGLRKLYVNMVPFPNLHFMIPGFAPLTSSERFPYQNISVPELVNQIFSSKNLLAFCDLKKGKILAVAAIFRGIMSPRQVDTIMTNIRNKNKEYFVDFIPNNIKTAICDIPPKGLKMSSTFIGNTTAIVPLLQRVLKSFKAMLQKKAYLHWYLDEGMELAEFKNSEECLKSLISEYTEQETKFTDAEIQNLDEANSDCCLNAIVKPVKPQPAKKATKK